jgi:cytochrome c2
MIRISKFVQFGLVIGAMTICSSVASAQSVAVDANQAKRGKTLWQNRGCAACHTIGKGRVAGPDLLGVTSRRDTAWLRRWLKNTDEMLASDSTAQSLLAEANGVKMPNLKLTDADVTALIHYLASESEKKQKGS